ncbi:MAG: cell wall metabolism sensor histidine kinase WalK [Clostridiales Family XIII bacterium]|jgi:two-component system sensor histidine kinase VicK|nr:cell wall metabolism sensor histidine kinase WalK [Clostridiales Family XIII bacterium]
MTEETFLIIFSVAAFIAICILIVFIITIINSNKKSEKMSKEIQEERIKIAEIKKNNLRLLNNLFSEIRDAVIFIDSKGKLINFNEIADNIFKLYLIEEKTFNEYIKLYNDELKLENLRENIENKIFQKKVLLGKDYYIAYFNVIDYEKEKDSFIIILKNTTAKDKIEKIQKDFVVNVSHELKTPLAVINSYAETLMAEEDINEIKKEADRMNRLITNLLRLSKLDFGEERLKNERVQVLDVLKSSVLRLKILWNEKKQQVNILNDDINIYVISDRGSLEQVFINIISNAIKYTDISGRIDVDFRADEDEVEIRFIDNGIGIPKKDEEKVFDRFYRVDKARSKKEGGTGLGLAIAKQIIESYKGKISIESEEGKGTKIIIKLPREKFKGQRNIA